MSILAGGGCHPGLVAIATPSVLPNDSRNDQKAAAAELVLAAALDYSAAYNSRPSFHPPLRLLYSVLPPSVANELRHKRPVPAKRYDNVSILFSGIVGFNAFCSKHASAEGAIKIVNLLNDVYTRFDILTDSRNNPYVYKVGSLSGAKSRGI